MVVEQHRNAELDTSYIRIAGAAPDSPLIYILPGNPGISEYYEQYMTELHSHLPEFEILSASHKGYDLSTRPGVLDLGQPVYSLDDQVANQRHFLESYVTSPRDVYILGHSVGAWFSQRLVAHIQGHEQIRIKFVGLLMPTIKDISLSHRGKRFTKLFGYGLNGMLAGYLVRFLYLIFPVGFLAWLVPKIMPQTAPKSAVHTSVNMIQRPQIIRQLIDMAGEEMIRIHEPVEPPEIRGFWSNSGYNIWALFAQKDHWVPDEVRAVLMDEFAHKGHISMEIAPSPAIAHAFVITGSIEVAQYTAEAIKSAS